MLYVSGGRLVVPLSAALLAACAGNGVGLDANGQPLGYSDGTPQLDSEQTRRYFVELHGFF
jgi:hypothetical protein